MFGNLESMEKTVQLSKCKKFEVGGSSAKPLYNKTWCEPRKDLKEMGRCCS